MKGNSVEDNVVEVVFIDSDLYETQCTVPSSSLRMMENETSLQVCLILYECYQVSVSMLDTYALFTFSRK